MNSEAKLVLELWDLVRDFIPSGRRTELAISVLRSFEEYGFDDKDIQDIVDEDVYLARAYSDLYGSDEDDHEEDDE